MSMSELILKEMYESTIKKIESVIKITEEHEMTNTQSFLEFLEIIKNINERFL